MLVSGSHPDWAKLPTWEIHGPRGYIGCIPASSEGNAILRWVRMCGYRSIEHANTVGGATLTAHRAIS